MIFRIFFIAVAASTLFSASFSLAIGQEVVEIPVYRDEPKAIAEAMRAARRALREGNGERQIVLMLYGGIYRITNTIEFGESDSGSSNFPLVVRSKAPGEARIVGSRILGADDELPLTEQERAQLPVAARDIVRAYRLNKGDIGREEPRGLVFPRRSSSVEVNQGGRAFRMARWPNEGYWRAGAVVDDGSKSRGAIFSAPQDRTVGWEAEKGLWIAGFFSEDWRFETNQVREVEGRRGLVKLMPLGHPRYPVRMGFRYFVYNALSELDRPGEFVVDFAARRLVVWPVDEDIVAHPIEIASVEKLLEVRNARFLRIEGIAFENARGDGITIENSSDIVIQDALVANVGGAGVVVRGGGNNQISRTVIADTGETGVDLSGGDRRLLESARHGVRDSIIVRAGRHTRATRPAVELSGVGQAVEGCFIADLPHMAVYFNGNDHTIRRNEITRVVTETSDAGAVYIGRDWTARGTVISENYLHDILPQPGKNIKGHPYEVKGVYLDDMASGIRVERNLFVRVGRPVFLGGGRDNEVLGNVIIDPDREAIYIDNRAETWNQKAIEGPHSIMRKRLAAMPYRGGLWRKRYPALFDILSDDPGAPKNNVIGPNVIVASAPYRIHPRIARLQKMGPLISEIDQRALVRLQKLGDGTLDDGRGLSLPFDLPVSSMLRERELRSLVFAGMAKSVVPVR